MTETEQKQQPEKTADDSPVLERTVFVENLRTSIEKLAKILKPLYAEKYGENPIVSMIRKRDGYEITFATPEAAKDCLDNGFKIENRQYDAVSLCNSDLLLNLNPVPSYVEDSALIKKLSDLGCTVVGEVKRHTVEGIETGRRKIVVRLPKEMRSLPRAIMVKSTAGRDERIEVFHRNQRIRKNTR
ncbi:hypothetical protein X975_06671, partial [Stegodyphus mimosarum]